MGREKIDNDPNAVPFSYLHLYMRGNAIWPQKHFVHPILIAGESIRVKNYGFRDLYQRHISSTQLGVVSSAMNRLHTDKDVQKIYGDPTLPSNQIVGENDIAKLWERAVVEAASWTLSLTRLTTGLQEDTESPHLKEMYYQDKNSILPELGRIDALLKAHPEETETIAQLLKIAESFFQTSDFRDLATNYKEALAAAHREGNQFLNFDGKLVSKKTVTQQGVNMLSDYLASQCPEYNWSKFNYQY